jgi:hypothetical protein
MKRKIRLRGQTLIEFALIFPLLIFLLIGFFDIGRAIFYYSSLSNAVREAARTGIVKEYGGYEDNEITDQVLTYGFGLGSLTSDDVVVEYREISNDYLNSGEEYQIDDEFVKYIEVTGKFCYEPITPGIISIINTTCWNDSRGIELKAVSIMLMEPGKSE